MNIVFITFATILMVVHCQAASQKCLESFRQACMSNGNVASMYSGYIVNATIGFQVSINSTTFVTSDLDFAVMMIMNGQMAHTILIARLNNMLYTAQWFYYILQQTQTVNQEFMQSYQKIITSITSNIQQIDQDCTANAQQNQALQTTLQDSTITNIAVTINIAVLLFNNMVSYYTNLLAASNRRPDPTVINQFTATANFSMTFSNSFCITSISAAEQNTLTSFGWYDPTFGLTMTCSGLHFQLTQNLQQQSTSLSLDERTEYTNFIQQVNQTLVTWQVNITKSMNISYTSVKSGYDNAIITINNTMWTTINSMISTFRNGTIQYMGNMQGVQGCYSVATTAINALVQKTTAILKRCLNKRASRWSQDMVEIQSQYVNARNTISTCTTNCGDSNESSDSDSGDSNESNGKDKSNESKEGNGSDKSKGSDEGNGSDGSNGSKSGRFKDCLNEYGNEGQNCLNGILTVKHEKCKSDGEYDKKWKGCSTKIIQYFNAQITVIQQQFTVCTSYVEINSVLGGSPLYVCGSNTA